MDEGLERFEKELAAEKAAREANMKGEKDRKHRHHHRSKHHHSSREHEDRDGHRHKRRRHSRDGDRDDDDHKSHRCSRRRKEDVPLAEGKEDDEDDADPPLKQTAKRDSWMTGDLDIDYKSSHVKKVGDPTKSLPNLQDSQHRIHKNELNHQLQELSKGANIDDLANKPAQHEVGYTFGDSGSQWRMTRLKAIYSIAKDTGRTVEDVALERYGDLREFDDAREEQTELERRGLYGEGYIGKEKPSGELFQERKMDMGIRRNHQPEEKDIAPELPPQGTIIEDNATPILDQTALNRMKAQLMKAKLKGAANAAQLEEEYNKAAAAFTSQKPEVVTLGVMDNRMLAATRGEVKSIDNKRGRERGLVEENEDMSIEDMVREERMNKGQAGGEGRRFAERIAKDQKFTDDLDYMDENANKLAKRVHKSEINLKNTAISDYQNLNRILDNCPLCHHEDKNLPPVAPVISLATRVYLTLPTEPELNEGGAVIVPIQHHSNLLDCDDDEWEEIRNFMKCLTRMYHDQGRDVIFYENAAAPQRKLHAAMQAIPLPYSLGETAPAFFKEAILASDEEWTQHKKLIDTAARARDGWGKLAFRRSIAKEMPYFHVWFELDGGLGHIVEDFHRWPRGDLFPREVIGGMLDLEPDVIKRQGRWTRGPDKRLEGFKKRWKKFDWTRVLADGQ